MHKIIVNISQQTLTLYQLDETSVKELITFSISTAKNGIGSQEASGCTPLGEHIIASKIGDNMPINTVFVGRVATGEIYNADLAEAYPDRDWILTRIMWLQGTEEGLNLGENAEGCCDTYSRYIYIHGTPDTEPMGEPLSHGCIRMHNQQLIWLYEQVEEGTPVSIIAK